MADQGPGLEDHAHPLVSGHLHEGFGGGDEHRVTVAGRNPTQKILKDREGALLRKGGGGEAIVAGFDALRVGGHQDQSWEFNCRAVENLRRKHGLRAHKVTPA